MRRIWFLFALACAAARPAPLTAPNALHQHRDHRAHALEEVAALPELKPLGRVVLSADPSASAAVFVHFFGGEIISDERAAVVSDLHECACTVSVFMPHHDNRTMTFVLDHRKPNPAPEFPMSQVLSATDNEVARVASKATGAGGESKAWSVWMDTNDGYGAPVGPDLESFQSLVSGFQCYGGILRFGIPNSTATVEVNIAPHHEDAAGVVLDGTGVHGDLQQGQIRWSNLLADDAPCVMFANGPDQGRSGPVDGLYGDYDMETVKGWWKGVVGTTNPKGANDFVLNYLGGVQVPTPYDNAETTARLVAALPASAAAVGEQLVHIANESPTGHDKAHSATWIWFNSSQEVYAHSWMLHFVCSEPSTAEAAAAAAAAEDPHFVDTSEGEPSPHALANSIEASRASFTADDVFDTYLYNALRFGVSSLAPFLARVRADGVQHIVRRSSAGSAGGSLLMPIPGALFAVELRSDTGLEEYPDEYPKVWDVCSSD